MMMGYFRTRLLDRVWQIRAALDCSATPTLSICNSYLGELASFLSNSGFSAERLHLGIADVLSYCG
jgi:hypothetical protein